jgi:glycosyltransferase involved in cell wall biosynthesis
MIKVSVIVTVFNIEEYIEKCLTSLINQTLSDIQIIVVNDGSKDNSGQIIKDYEEKYKNKIIYIEKENGGAADARNTGIEYAVGEYIGFVDGDDFIELTMYEKMYSLAKKENADFVECNYFYDFPNYSKPRLYNSYELDEILIHANPFVWNKIVRSEIIKKNNLKYQLGIQPCEDIEFVCKIIPYLERVSFIKEPLYHYLQRSNSIIHFPDENNLRNGVKVHKIIVEYFRNNGFYKKYETQLEYLITRDSLCSVFPRILKLPNRVIRMALLKENWSVLIALFPNWKRNVLLRQNQSKINFYLKTINYFTYIFYSKLFRIIDF